MLGMYSALDPLLERIAVGQTLEFSEWPSGDVRPEDLGLTVVKGRIVAPATIQRLHLERLNHSLESLGITLHQVVDSTNTMMLERAKRVSVGGLLYLAECQVGGRGRRGKQWISPYGRSLSISLGFSTGRELKELGGLSSVVGLVLVQALSDMGARGLQLKWPNDVLAGGQKLCGILVELVPNPQRNQCVIGVGINVALTDREIEAVDQPVIDLQRLNVDDTRTDITIGVVKAMQKGLDQFEREGFAAFVEAFNRVHLFHGEPCVVWQGSERIEGIVKTIGGEGELVMVTSTGEQRFFGGEVSLRRS